LFHHLQITQKDSNVRLSQTSKRKTDIGPKIILSVIHFLGLEVGLWKFLTFNLHLHQS